jgi:hypothetical protein
MTQKSVELNDLYCSPNTIRVIKEMGGACGVWGDRRGVCRVLVGKLEGRRALGSPGRRWRIILKCIFKKRVGAWTGLSRLRIWLL